MKPLKILWFSDKNGPNGRNSAGIVHINRHAKHKTAIYVQEAMEAEQKLKDMPKFRFRFFWSDNRVRDMEFRSHMAECLIKMDQRFYGLNQWDAMHPEAQSMQRGYDGLFSHYSITEIKNHMFRFRNEAEDWISDNYKHIKEFYDKFG